MLLFGHFDFYKHVHLILPLAIITVVLCEEKEYERFSC